MTPPIADGVGDPTTIHNTTTSPVVMVGDVQAKVVFSGILPGFPGVYQVNIIIQPGTPTGNAIPLQIQMGGITTSNQVRLQSVTKVTPAYGDRSLLSPSRRFILPGIPPLSTSGIVRSRIFKYISTTAPGRTASRGSSAASKSDDYGPRFATVRPGPVLPVASLRHPRHNSCRSSAAVTGRGPTSDISPRITCQSCGISSTECGGRIAQTNWARAGRRDLRLRAGSALMRSIQRADFAARRPTWCGA